MSGDVLHARLCLLRACPGARQYRELLEAAGGDPLLAVARLLPSRLPRAQVEEARREADLDRQWLDHSGARLLALGEDAYPGLLGRIASPPPVLFVRGDADLLWAPQLAIVGSRQATAGGLATAADFAGALAERGFVITSGLALGIDAAAHAGALEGGGRTIAVLGTGLDRIYPARNAALARRIEAAGTLVSEFPPRSEPRREHFPRRNRIIAGLSLGTLVVEAGLASGSLSTARLAAEMGREVYAIPGSIHNPVARGCHQLIREGAKLVETAQEVVDELAPMVRELQQALALHAVPASARPTAAAVPRAGAGDPDYTALRRALGHDPVPLDELARRTGLTIPALSSMLLRMELEGEVAVNPGGTYSRRAG